MRRFIIRDGLIMEHCITYLNSLSLEPIWEVTIKEHKPNRSNDQNALYWGLLDKIALEYEVPGDDGRPRRHHPDVWHEFFKREVLGVENIIVNDIVHTVPKSSRKLTTAQFAELIENVRAWAAQQGLIIE